MVAPISKERLIQLSNNKSFKKGEAYFKGQAVKSVVKAGNTYKGKVEGSELYQVSIELKAYDINAYCNCPYSFGGMCKHAIAVGLAIIEEDYSEEEDNEQIVYHSFDNSSSVQTMRAEEHIQINANNFYDQVFAVAPIDVQKAFLRQLFQKNEPLRSQFANFLEKGESLDAHIASDIEMIREEVNRELSGLEFGYEVFDYVNRRHYGRYVEEWELAYDGSVQMIEEVFEGYEKNAINHIQRGNLVAGMAVLLGLYEGYFNVTEPASDEYSNFESYNDELTTLFEQVASKVAQEIESAIKTETIVSQLIELIFERVHYFHLGEDLLEEEEGIVYQPKKWEKLLNTLIINSEVGLLLEGKMDDSQWIGKDTAFIRLKIANETGNDDKWIKIAETFAGEEIELVAKLLNKYGQLGRTKDFYRIAKKAFKIWPYQVDEQLIDKISPEQDKAFYIKVLSNYTSRKANILTYQKLRKLWTKPQKEQFIEKNRNQQIFYVQILEVEKRHADILQFVQGNLQSYHFQQLIQPIITIYPDTCFNIIRKKTLEVLEEGRGRELYREVCGWLSLLKKLQGKETMVKYLFDQVYNGPPRLPALKDEMKKAGLM